MVRINSFLSEESDIRTGYHLEGFIYENICYPNLFNNLKKTISSIIKSSQRNTFLTHGTTFFFENKKNKLISHKGNNREQIVIYDQSLQKEWFYQTKSSIKKWSDELINKNAPPVFIKIKQILENLEPFSSSPEDWIFYRLHINYLAPNKLLSLHYDGRPDLIDFKTTKSDYDVRLKSVTFYLYDHVEGQGGELWTPYGFVYKPKANTAILINGNQVQHGVTEHTGHEPREAFTMRVYHKNDLNLLGNPEKFLFNPLNTI